MKNAKDLFDRLVDFLDQEKKHVETTYSSIARLKSLEDRLSLKDRWSVADASYLVEKEPIESSSFYYSK